ncbi:hypothetical protein BN8_01803 [Fibrisoma limi BUZ 3]|uniref:Uncharacterized protein n=1 Tax=Fibrisoma limi BUZ 3 TaxID=1185876 RepID=I2GFV0_9BACT|nr:hypothetical protein BN8_01803 [Fibrisoma limi BUZ 3]
MPPLVTSGLSFILIQHLKAALFTNNDLFASPPLSN